MVEATFAFVLVIRVLGNENWILGKLGRLRIGGSDGLEEQRSSEAISGDVSCHAAQVAENGEMPMKGNNTIAPRSKLDWRNVTLVVLQIVVVLFTNKLTTLEVASRALP